MTLTQEKLLLENQIAIMGLLQYSNCNLSHDLSEECRVQIAKSKARIDVINRVLQAEDNVRWGRGQN